MSRIIMSQRCVVVLASLLAFAGALGMSGATLAQPPDAEAAAAERAGPEVAPAKRTFGDLSVALRNLARQALPSIVSIDAIRPPSEKCHDPSGDHALGCGFVVDPAGRILTSSRLVIGADRVKVSFHDGSELFATSVRTDPRSDTAVIEVSPVANLQALTLGDSDALQVGDWVLALGRSSRLAPTAQAGIMNGVVPGPGAARSVDFIQTDAASHRGVAGGPLLNLDGQVVGIATTVCDRKEGFPRTGVAAPSNLVRWASQQLIDHGVVRRAFLGVHTQQPNHGLAQQFGVPPGQGALVNRVIPNSPAAEALIQPGDIIMKFDGQPVLGSRHLHGMVERLEAGKTYPVQVVRDGGSRDLRVTLGSLTEPTPPAPQRPQIDDPAKAPTRADTFAALGLTVREMTPGAIQQGDTQDHVAGVIIDSIRPGSPAAAAGLRNGMVIERVGRTKVTSAAEFSTTEAGIAANNGVLFYVHTPQGPRFVVVDSQGM